MESTIVDIAGYSVTPFVLLSMLGSFAIASLLVKFCRNSKGPYTQPTRKGRGNSTMLLGNCDVGKTALLGRMKTNSFIQTVTSQAINNATVSLKDGKSVSVIDYPGHGRLRQGLWQHIAKADAIVFVLDANAKDQAFMLDADYLYSLFTHPQVNDARTPLCIACNKSDMMTARAKEEIQKILETELNQIRTDRLTIPGQAGQTDIYLGIEGEKFIMDHLPFHVEFLEMSVKDGSGLSELDHFMGSARQL